MRRTTASLALLALLALAGCAGPTAPGDSPSAPRPSSTAGPTSTVPSDADDPTAPAVVTRVILRTESLVFADDDTEFGGVGFDRPHLEIAARLAEVFGSAPEIETVASDDGETTYYEWPGFLLFSGTGGGQIGPPTGVHVTAERVGGVAIETLHGVRVGMPFVDARLVADAVVAEYETVEARFDELPFDPGGTVFVVVYGEPDGSGDVRILTGPIWSSGY